MRRLVISVVFGCATAATAASAFAETPGVRVATMPFAECIALIDEAVQEEGVSPVQLVRTGDERAVRLDAADGFVTIACSRADNKVTLSKQVMTAAARMPITR